MRKTQTCPFITYKYIVGCCHCFRDFISQCKIGGKCIFNSAPRPVCLIGGVSSDFYSVAARPGTVCKKTVRAAAIFQYGMQNRYALFFFLTIQMILRIRRICVSL